MDSIKFDFDNQKTVTNQSITNGCILDKINGVTLIQSGESSGPKVLKIKPRFTYFHPKYEWCSEKKLKILTKHLFQSLYYSGNSQFLENGEEVEVITVETTSRYFKEDNQIWFSRNEPNPLVFIHELIHAIIFLNGCKCEDNHRFVERIRTPGICSLLYVFLNNAPGLMMDLITLIQMNDFSNSEILNAGIQYGQYHVPIVNNSYTDTLEYCKKLIDEKIEINAEEMYNTIHNAENSVSDKYIESDQKFINELVNTNSSKLMPSLEKNINGTNKNWEYIEQFFYHKFEDEYKFINEITRMNFFEIEKEKYVKLNVDHIRSMILK